MRMLRILSATCIAAVLSTLATPSAWPQAATRKIIVPYTPGSGPDILARLMAEQIGAHKGPTMVVENRPGGGTAIGTEAAARAEPDGNTVLMVANAFVVNAAMKRGNYDVAKSFEPVCNLAATPMVFVVQASSPYKTIQDLVAAAKEKPGQISFASGGPATSLHVAIEVLKRATHIDTNYVPYGGTAPAINVLMGGHVQAVAADYPTIVSQLKEGTLRYEAEIFYGVVAPAKTPAATLKELSDAFLAALKAPEMQPKLAQQGLFPVGTCGADFGNFLRASVAEYERVITEAGIKAN